jgi:hypothetical protein
VITTYSQGKLCFTTKSSITDKIRLDETTLTRMPIPLWAFNLLIIFIKYIFILIIQLVFLRTKFGNPDFEIQYTVD